MVIRRIVPNIQSAHFEQSCDFYIGFLGMRLAMETQTIATFASPGNPTAQVSVPRNL